MSSSFPPRVTIRAAVLRINGRELQLTVDPRGVSDIELMPNGWLAVLPWGSDPGYRTMYPPHAIEVLHTFEPGRVKSDRYAA